MMEKINAWVRSAEWEALILCSYAADNRYFLNSLESLPMKIFAI